MKKAFSVLSLLCFLIALSAQNIASAQARSALTFAPKHYSNATIDDNFSNDSVIVVLDKVLSKINKIQDKLFSPVLKYKEILDLSYISNEAIIDEIDQQNYQQIFKITLNKSGKDEVLKAIRLLEAIPGVQSAEPDFLYDPAELEENVVSQISDFNDPTINQPSSSAYESTNPETDISSPAAIPNDPKYSSQYALSTINASAAWNMTTGLMDVRVGIIDSGIAKHADLNSNCTSGWDFYNKNATTDDVEKYSHGTAVAGVVGARGNNSLGISGVCWNVTLVPLQVVITDGSSNDGLFSGSAIQAAINYAQNNNIPIINCSFGSLTSNFAYTVQIRNYTGLVICAAGNESVNTDLNPCSPAGTPLDNVISVAATDSSDNLASYSNYGATTVDLAAPGNSILTTSPSGGYVYSAGTSMAAPMVTGVAALLKSYNSDLSSSQIKACIMQGVDKIPSLTGKCVSGGRLNAYKALQAAQMTDGTFVSGDFDGDGKQEMAAFYGYDSFLQLVTWDNVSSSYSYDLTQGTVVCTSPDFRPASFAGNVAAGDFDGDGKDEIGLLFDYGDTTGFWIFKKQSSTSFSASLVGKTGNMYASKMSYRVAAGDFDGDGRDELGALYDYGSYAGFWLFKKAADNSFLHYCVGTTGEFSAGNVSNRVTAGDFDGDGKDELGAIFDYGSSSGFWIFKHNNDLSLMHYCVGRTGDFYAGNISGRVAGGDFDGDGKDELGALFDYGSCVGFWVFKRDSDSSLTHYRVGTTGEFDASKIYGRVVAGKYDNDNIDELVAMYNYSDFSKLWLFKRTSSGTFMNYRIS